jgi:hypothetical protein
MLELQGARTLCEGMPRTKQAKGNISGHLLEMQPKGTLCKEMQREKHFKTSENGITEGMPQIQGEDTTRCSQLERICMQL